MHEDRLNAALGRIEARMRQGQAEGRGGLSIADWMRRIMARGAAEAECAMLDQVESDGLQETPDD